jgi:hypothetical protein
MVTCRIANSIRVIENAARNFPIAENSKDLSTFKCLSASLTT